MPILLSREENKSNMVIDDVEDYYKPPPPKQIHVVVQDESDPKSTSNDVIAIILGSLNSQALMPLTMIAKNLPQNSNNVPSKQSDSNDDFKFSCHSLVS
jgi:hypothetical protein